MRDSRYEIRDMRYILSGAFFGGVLKSAGIINCHFLIYTIL